MPEYALRLAAICSGEFINQRRYYVIREMVQELRRPHLRRENTQRLRAGVTQEHFSAITTANVRK